MFTMRAPSVAFRAFESGPLEEINGGELGALEESSSMSIELHSLSILLFQSPTRRSPSVSNYDYGYEIGKNINDIIEERKWEVRKEGNWSDVEGEEFIREYMDLRPLPPSPSRRSPQLRLRGLALNPPLLRDPLPPSMDQTSKQME